MIPSPSDQNKADAASDATPSGDATPLSLLERARASDAQAWGQLVQLYRPLVLVWCRHSGLNSLDAEDLSQEVFAAVARGLPQFHRDQPGDTFRGWLRVVTRNQILLHVRRNAGQPQAAGGSDAWQRLQDVADPLVGCEAEEQVEFSRVCHRVMEQVRGDFEDKTWQAFWLTVIEGRLPATLTAELGMSTASIRQAKSRVLRFRHQAGSRRPAGITPLLHSVHISLSHVAEIISSRNARVSTDHFQLFFNPIEQFAFGLHTPEPVAYDSYRVFETHDRNHKPLTPELKAEKAKPLKRLPRNI